MVENVYKKKQKQISFAYKEGHDALEWLIKQADKECRGNCSAYIVELLLEDKKRKESKE